ICYFKLMDYIVSMLILHIIKKEKCQLLNELGIKEKHMVYYNGHRSSYEGLMMIVLTCLTTFHLKLQDKNKKNYKALLIIDHVRDMSHVLSLNHNVVLTWKIQVREIVWVYLFLFDLMDNGKYHIVVML
ncbi:hypothetical protein ACJX0J_032230, partial [Zea mays]